MSDNLKKNWLRSTDQPIEYGYWAPEIVAEWSYYDGWNQSINNIYIFVEFETLESDLWALGLVFLESMVL